MAIFEDGHLGHLSHVSHVSQTRFDGLFRLPSEFNRERENLSALN